MSLRRTVILIICVTFTGLFAILFVISHVNIRESFDDMEREEVEEELVRSVNILGGEAKAVDTLTADWGMWDDLYRYAKERNAEFYDTNITPQSFGTLRVNLIMLFGEDGGLIFARACNPGAEAVGEAPKEIVDKVAAIPRLTRHADEDSQASGMLAVAGEVYLLASRPVLTSGREGPVRGALVMARRLDAARLQTLSDLLRLDLGVTPLSGRTLSLRQADVAAALIRSGNLQIVPENEATIRGYALVKDLADAPAALVSIALPRSIHKQGAVTLRYNFIALVAIGVTFGLAMLYLVENRILSRITSLSAQIGRLGREGGELARTAVPGKDEIAGLSVAINAMLADLETARDRIEEGRARYEMATRAAKVGVFDLAVATGSFYVDPSLTALLGYTAEEMGEGLDGWIAHVHPEDRERVGRGVKRCLSGEADEFASEHRMLARDGAVRYSLLRGRAVRDAAGTVVRFLGTDMDVTELKKAEESIRELTVQLITAQESERARIARDLHDNVAQDLSSLKILCETFQDGQASPSEETARKLADLTGTLSRAIASVRDISYDLAPPDLEHLGLVKAVGRLCAEFSRVTGIPCDFAAAGLEGVAIAGDAAINLYRIAQEALGNVRRHATATAVSVRLVESYPRLILRVKDNGRGFAVAPTLRQAREEKRMGLRGMRERVGLFDGSLRIDSTPGKGCVVVAEIPYAGQEHHGIEAHPHC